ncbi:hypothetical protein AKJ65_01175 [candidate division MSBL1 archaeon SCGC-AAA259E19]|uniref:HD/PDEase domain-containing protein n=2 Tax=candidate division MSBL1 TaxID=215777 RepID=A0A133UEC3_9EURY|nr:hypothetical protein AKJ64_02820 [candidate division MSBL1 archaeon SCGC-AAA259E17]KXA95674.1 hypothetical protein AKJ65_01175 [candidate division MSBL1 archaeon SCGC-AAA259E19]
MISIERALRILSEEGCSPEVIRHSFAVSKKSAEIARKISENGHDVDLELVKVGAILHDVGRSRTHDISHGVEGSRILRERGLGELARFAERHLGAGITVEEAEKLSIPTKDYLPESLEEKVVAYADNLLRGEEVISFQEALEELQEELGPDHPSLDRFRKIHRKLRELGGI